MTVTSGFFNSLNNSQDRRYNSEQMSSLFAGIIEDGVLSSIGDIFHVAESIGMAVRVDSGKAWWIESWIENNAPILLQVPPAHPTFNRIDLVILDFNKNDDVRANTIQTLQGVATANCAPPKLIQEPGHWQVAIAGLSIIAGSSSIPTVNITQLVGTDDCPFSVGIMDQISASYLYTRWELDFQAWFDSIKDQLSGDDAASLQAQIDALVPPPRSGRNMIINGDMSVLQRGSDTEYIIFLDPPYPHHGYLNHTPSLWFTYIDHNYEFISFDPQYLITTKEIPTEGVVRNWLSVERLTTMTGVQPASDKCYIEQTIEAALLYDIKKGDVDAEPLYLSFRVMGTLVGDYIVEVEDPTNNRHVSLPYSITQSMVDTRITITIPKDVIGSIPLTNDMGLIVRFWLRAGSDYRSGVNPTPMMWGGVVDNLRAPGQVPFGETPGEFLITDVQLESGRHTVYERLSPMDNLKKCERYLEWVDEITTGKAVKPITDRYAPTNVFLASSSPFATPKRSVDETSLVIGSQYLSVLTDFATDTWVDKMVYHGFPPDTSVGNNSIHFGYEATHSGVDMVRIHTHVSCEFPPTFL